MDQKQHTTEEKGRPIPRMPRPHFEQNLIDFHRLGNLLLAKGWIIAAVACAIFLAAVAYVVWTPRTYESRAVIQVQQEAQKVVNIANVSEDKPETTDYLNTVVQAFSSRDLMLRVIQSTGLDKDPEFAPPQPDGTPYTELDLASRMSRKVKIALRRGTRLVDITAFDSNPVMAEKIAGAFVKEFLRESFAQRRSLSRVANEFLQDEAQQLKTKLEDAERKLQAYREENNAVSLEERQNITVEKLRDLNTAVTEATTSRLKLEADLEQFKRVGPNNVEELLRIDSISKLPEVALIRDRLFRMENAISALEKRYFPKHPRHIAAMIRLAQLKEAMAETLAKAGDSLARDYESAREAEDKLGRSLKDQEQIALELNRLAIPYNVLQRDVESDRALFESVTLRLKETYITQGIDNPPFRLIEEPLVASFPSKPRKKVILGLALVLGVTLGVCGVIGLDTIDSSLRTVDEAESYLGLPSLATIPDRPDTKIIDAARKMLGKRDLRPASAAGPFRGVSPKESGVNGSDPTRERTRTESDSNPLILVEDPHSEQSEAFRTLRASISLLGKESEYRSFLFASAVPSEGKTFTALNFASSVAQQGFKTVIIDADLREPRLNRDLLDEAGDVPGLTDVLSGQIELKDALKSTWHDNLVLLPAGHRAPDPAHLLDNHEFGRILEELLRHFERVVIDSPPVNAVSDALLIGADAHATCLVVRAGKTPKKAILRALHQLENANAKVAGFIFNRLPAGGRSSGYYYYSYGGRYTKNGAHKQPEAHSSSSSLS
jgi:succinoglycan biosynthesis transport protein ExoP